MGNDYQTLVEFWNKNFSLSEEDKKEILSSEAGDDPSVLAPSKKLYDALFAFKGMNGVLDYGSGSGWASIGMAKLGVKGIVAAEVAHDSLELLSCYAKAFGVDGLITPTPIDEKWLSAQKAESFEGFFCSNVIDVVPLDMAKAIIKDSANCLKAGGTAIYGLNYYIDPRKMEERGYVVKDRQVYIDGVLRLTALKDEEWKEIFENYFEVIGLSYFAWPGEEKETRRLFVLRKR